MDDNSNRNEPLATADPIEPLQLDKSAVVRPSRSPSDKIRVALGATLLLAIVGGTIALLAEVESVVFTFPLCAVVGLSLAVGARRLSSWRTFLWAMSAPIAVITCAMTIAVFELNPREAGIPIRCLWCVYAALAVPLGLPAMRTLVAWRSREHARRTGVWRFQVKFLLIQTLVLSVVLAMVKMFSGAHTDYMMFASGSAAIIFIGGVVVSAFVAEIRSASQNAVIDEYSESQP